MKTYDIGFDRAYRLVAKNAVPIGKKILPVQQAVGRVLSDSLSAKVNSPSINASLKDGYAVISADLSDASPEKPVKLEVVGSVAAGGHSDMSLARGQVIRILTGAPLPEGAEAVLAEEFTDAGGDGKWIVARATAEPARNVQPKGEDVHLGEKLAQAGDMVSPQLVGRLVAGGIAAVSVFQKPRVGLLATGSEILLPGKPPVSGKLYASNVALQQAWLANAGIDTEMLISADFFERIAEAIRNLYETCDVVITSGGAWKGDRDLVVKVLESLGWEMFFHRARMGPGKAVGAGRLKGKPVYCLPGGPASNEAAFIMIVFPAILKMSGFRHCPYLYLTGRLESDVHGQSDWTQFIQCEILQKSPEILLRPSKLKSRLAAMTQTPAVLKIPEGTEKISAGTMVPFICLDRKVFEWPIDDAPSP
ncbi:MAG TPA: molybdopterin molybdotransferase MoeA [Desulfosalsimonadaceae bacterium]|nr:molybdopterin molybdotransferase MoeA [Desulfosalsimonadaceae bacterium]